MLPPHKSTDFANEIPAICLKSDFEKVFEQEYFLARRTDDELSLISLRITLNNPGEGSDYGRQFENYVDLLLQSINQRIRSTDVVCRCTSLHIIILCRRTEKTQACNIARQIESVLHEQTAAFSKDAFGLKINCVSSHENVVDQPVDIIQKMLVQNGYSR